MTHIITTLDTLQALARFATKDETRYYLQGVYIERNRMTATDGHRLAHIKPNEDMYWDDGEFVPFILPAETIKNIKVKAKKNHVIYVAIDTLAKRIGAIMWPESTELNADAVEAIMSYGASISYEPIDGTFPDYKRAIPALNNYEKPTNGGAFNPKYLGDFDFLDTVVVFMHENRKAPAIIRGEHDHFDMLGVLMPMFNNADRVKDIIPDWYVPAEINQPNAEAA